MRYYLYNGKIYRSHNKEALIRRLFRPTIGHWGEYKIHKMDSLKKLLVPVKKGDIK